MENESEEVINAVKPNRPNLLTGLNQNGKRTGWGRSVCPHTTVAPPAKKPPPNLVTSRLLNLVSLLHSRISGREIVRNPDNAVGKGKRTKRIPS
jgi:hypothetical protein